MGPVPNNSLEDAGYHWVEDKRARLGRNTPTFAFNYFEPDDKSLDPVIHRTADGTVQVGIETGGDALPFKVMDSFRYHTPLFDTPNPIKNGADKEAYSESVNKVWGLSERIMHELHRIAYLKSKNGVSLDPDDRIDFYRLRAHHQPAINLIRPCEGDIKREE